jgi:hypothetical protein
MHEYFMNDLARTSSEERLRAADQHRLTRAARQSRKLRSATIGSRVRAAFRIGPFAEPVRPAPPRARFLVRQAPARETESGTWVA